MSVDIFHGSALDLGPEIFEDFHALICDPPYSPHVHESCTSVGVAGGGLGAHKRELGFTSLSDELLAKVAECAATVKRWSAIYSDVESTHRVREACAGAEYIRPLPWIRWSQPQLSGDRPCTILEILSVFHAQSHGARGGVKPLKKHWNGPGNIMPHATRELLASLTDRAMRGQDKHPTEKPIDQVLHLVSWFSDPGESVIDLCAGSGTTAIACRLLDRHCLAVEIDDTWARRAESRVKAPLSARDHARAEEWCVTVTEEAEAILATPPAADGSDANTRRRAECRIADVERVMGHLT